MIEQIDAFKQGFFRTGMALRIHDKETNTYYDTLVVDQIYPSNILSVYKFDVFGVMFIKFIKISDLTPEGSLTITRYCDTERDLNLVIEKIETDHAKDMDSYNNEILKLQEHIRMIKTKTDIQSDARPWGVVAHMLALREDRRVMAGKETNLPSECHEPGKKNNRNEEEQY